MKAPALQLTPGGPRLRVLGVRQCIDAVAAFFATDGVDRAANAPPPTLDALPRDRHGRIDASSSLYAATLVRQTIAEFFKHEYPELKWVNGGLVNIDTSLHEGTQAFSWHEMGVVGEADFIADDATDIPRADIYGQENLGRAHTVASHFQYNRQEVATAQLLGTGINLVDEKSRACRLLLDERLNRTIALGRSELGFGGMVNAPGMIVDAAITGNWAAATPAQILADFTAAWAAVLQGSNGILDVDTVVMPISIWTRLTTLQNSAASDATVLDFLKKTAPQIKRWEWDIHMNTASPAGGRAMLFYKNDKSVVRAMLPRAIQFLPEQESALSLKIIGWGRYAGVIAPQPRAMLLLTGI